MMFWETGRSPTICICDSAFTDFGNTACAIKLSICAIGFRNFYIISDIIIEKKKEVEHDKNCNM